MFTLALWLGLTAATTEPVPLLRLPKATVEVRGEETPAARSATGNCSIPLVNVLPAAPDPPMPKVEPRGRFNMPLLKVPAPPCEEKPYIRLRSRP
jgi:hypothetical protein